MDWIKQQHRALAMAIAALVIVGAHWAGLPASTLLLLAFVVACPLPRMPMHGGGDHDGHGNEDRDARAW